MADKEFLRLSDRWDLAYDGRQWIIRKRVSADGNPKERWKAVAFFPGKKEHLLRCLYEKGVTIDPLARKALRDLPATFYEWLSNHDPAAWHKNPAMKYMPEPLSGAQQHHPAKGRPQAPKKSHRALAGNKTAPANVG